MIDLYVELKTVLQALETAGVPYALCGGLALMVYQRPRATVDIDLILPAEVAGRCIEALAPLGFRAHPRPMRFEASGIEIHRFCKLEEGGPDVLMLDCLLLKRLRGSPLDLLDIEALEALKDQHPDAFPGSDHACP